MIKRCPHSFRGNRAPLVRPPPRIIRAPPAMSGIDAVCFDLDGTLCVSAQDRDRLLADAFSEVGIEQAFDIDDLWVIDTRVRNSPMCE